jgi:hypothetical protein
MATNNPLYNSIINTTIGAQGNITGAAIGTQPILTSSNYSTAYITNTTLKRSVEFQVGHDMIKIYNKDGSTLLTVDYDGKVTWHDGIQIDEAAEAFSQVIWLSAEQSSRVTSAVKRKIRDTIFEELLEIAKEHGTLTPEDVEYTYKCCKIMDKLNGI